MALHSLFGPSKDEIWQQIAKDIDGEFIDRGFWKTNVLRYSHKEWELLLDTIHRDKMTFTRLRVPFLNKDNLYFKIYREGFFSDIGKFFGMQDIEIGDPRFDDNYIIQSNNNNKVRKLLKEPKLKMLFEMVPKIHVSIRKDEGWFGRKYPQGVHVLYFEQTGILKDKETLKLLFRLFTEILDQLVHIDSAYENDPKMKL
ncbi:DUF3137 domain-containing protein [Spongiivirga citrea]|uniref:DUF3137 domain-containing protein n=1 Tax=Spongiivirga citrea TaxID=1481457 RepID=A0A6M0CMF5_9FLAO|nr:DUF3137 domain-containing protein [Spongiivirga citrea]NER17009.1 DUF3137 domain-containing protein [Spongiivirga citrea]